MGHRDRWEQFCLDVRDDPDAALPMEDYLAEDFAQIAMTLASGTVLYRARRGFVSRDYGERQAFDGDGIGAPPVEKAEAGRVNVCVPSTCTEQRCEHFALRGDMSDPLRRDDLRLQTPSRRLAPLKCASRRYVVVGERIAKARCVQTRGLQRV